ncbi:MAG: hypothetical protein RLZZ546_1054 [Bacteroidota bacterium]|jgi:hypothetical protein
MNTLNKYRYFCNTENKFVFKWDNIPPTTCINDSNHSIDINSITIVDSLSRNEVIVSNRDPITQGYFMVESKTFNISSSNESIFTFSYPLPVAVYRSIIATSNIHNGDSIDISIAPETIIGVNTQEVLNNNNIIKVNSSILNILSPGFYIDITDGVNTNNLGRVLNIDKINEEITVEYNTINNFSIGSYIRLSMHIVKNLKFPHAYIYIIGSSTLGGKPIPSNTPIQLKYYNSNNQEKEFTITFEYTY